MSSKRLDADGFILSGGAARRAGGINKSLMRVEGRAIIEHQLERLRPLFGDCITIVTDRPEDFASRGVKCIPDLEIAGVERCALRGVATALAAPGGAIRFLLAADMPHPDARSIRAQCERIHAAGGEVMASLLKGARGAEPFHGVYRAEAAGSAIAALKAGERAMRRWIASLGAVATLGPADLGLDPAAIDRCLANWNAPPGP